MSTTRDAVVRPAPSIGVGAKLAVAAAAMLVGFGLCEIAARVMFHAPPQPAREPQILYEAHPKIGFLHVPNQTGWLDDGLAAINALGLRGPLPFVPKPEGSVRVLAIGDSMTFGWGVGDEEAYPAVLERLLGAEFQGRRLDVVNGGVGAYNLGHAARLLRHFAPELRPDVVLVGLFWNDLSYEGTSPDGAGVRAAAATPPSAPASHADSGASAAPSKPFRIGNNPSRLNRLLRSSRLLFALRHAWLAAIAPTEAANNQVQWEMAILEGRETPAIDAAWREAEETLAGIRDQGKTAGFAVGIVTMPIRAQVEGQYPEAAYQTRVEAMARSLGIFVVDPLPSLVERAQDDLFIPYDRMHMTAQGNALVARAAFEVLRRRPEFMTPPVEGVAP